MNKKIDLIIKNGKVFYKNKFQIINVIVNKGKILEISNNIKSYEAKKIIDAKNRTVIPGVVDVHFHVRAPSFPERGTVESETKADLGRRSGRTIRGGRARGDHFCIRLHQRTFRKNTQKCSKIL